MDELDSLFKLIYHYTNGMAESVNTRSHGYKGLTLAKVSWTQVVSSRSGRKG